MIFHNVCVRSGFILLAIASLGLSPLALAKIKKRDAFPQLDLKVIQRGLIPISKANRGSRAIASLETPLISTQVYKGKVVLVDFWASWCEPCKLSLPAYDKLQSKYKKKGLVVLGVNVDSDETLARSFLAAHQVGFPIVYDTGQKLAGKLEIALMPTSYIIDRKGNVKAIHQGFRAGDVSEIEKSIQKVL